MMPKINHRKSSPFFRLVRSANWILITVVLIMGTFGKRGWFDLKRMQNENRRIHEELMKLEEQKDVLSSEIHALQQDKQTQEHTIRRVLGYIKPDETVIEF